MAGSQYMWAIIIINVTFYLGFLLVSHQIIDEREFWYFIFFSRKEKRNNIDARLMN